MGQKVNPISNRLGIVRGWDSNWFGGKDFGDNLVEDQKIRKYLNERLAKASVSKIVIERTLKLVTITICTARPGIVIGKGGQDVDKLALARRSLRYLRIFWSSTRLSPKFLPPNQLESHPLMIPKRLLIGLTFCPILLIVYRH